MTIPLQFRLSGLAIMSCERNRNMERRESSAILLSVLLLVLGTSSCNLFSGSSGPPPEVSIVQAKDLGVIPTNPDILGRDGANSALFQGQSVWLYSDTFLAKPDAQDRTLISDSWSFTTNLNAQNGLSGFREQLDTTGAPTMILPETVAEQAFNQLHNVNHCQAQPCGARWALWPSSIVVNSANGSALIFYSVISAQPGAFNFQSIGNSVATWQNLQSQPVRLVQNPAIVVGHPDVMFPASQPEFGDASFISNGVLYAYGCGIPANSGDRGCRLGRADPSRAQDLSAWTFYARNGNWSSNVGDAVTLFDGAGSIYWNSFLQLYVAIYSGVFTQNVMIRTSPKPEGPWSGEAVAFVAMTPASGNVFDAHAHAEYDINSGQTIFVSYSRSTSAPFSSEERVLALTLQRSK